MKVSDYSRIWIAPGYHAKAPPGQQSRFPIENVKCNNEVVNEIFFQADGKCNLVEIKS